MIPRCPATRRRRSWAQLRAAVGQASPTLNFEYEAQFARPAWPARPGEPVATEHLDIAVTSLDEGVAWAVAAQRDARGFQPQEDVRVLFDPAGHPFCLYVP